MIRAGLVLLAIGAGGVSIARADNAAEATKLFEDGLALQAAGKHPEACAQFARSYELDRQASRPAPGTQLNLGDCAEREGQLRRAYLLFDDASREYDRRGKAADARLAAEPGSADAKRDSDRAAAGKQLARARADAITPKLAHIVLRLAERPDGMTVRIGDRAIPPAAEIVELLDAGEVRITVAAPGREPFTALVKGEPSTRLVIDVPALPLADQDHGTPRASEPGNRRDKGRVRIALGLGAGGIAMLAVSGTFGLLARSQAADGRELCNGGSECPDNPAGREGFDKQEAAGTKADVATYTAIAGGALVCAAIAVYFTAPKEQVTVTPMASANGAGVSLTGRF